MKRGRTGEVEPMFKTNSVARRLSEAELNLLSTTQRYVLEDDENKTIFTAERVWSVGSRVREKQTNRTRVYLD
jgi:hypothetical protein